MAKLTRSTRGSGYDRHWLHAGAVTIFFGAHTLTLAARTVVETHGPFGTLIAGLGLGAFYLALIWINLLLGHMLVPLFLIPLTWIQDAFQRRKATSTS